MTDLMKNIPFTRFMDMHSGGGCKTDYSKIYIEASQDEAETIFEQRFGRSPHNITCDCCGNDYSIDESPTLEQASGYDRGCKWENGQYIEETDGRSWNKYMPLSQYVGSKGVLVIYANGVEQ